MVNLKEIVEMVNTATLIAPVQINVLNLRAVVRQGMVLVIQQETARSVNFAMVTVSALMTVLKQQLTADQRICL